MPRNGHTIKISDDLWDAFKAEREPGGTLSDYPSDNAAIENMMFYMLAFRRLHTLAEVSKLKYEDQDLIHAFVKFTVLQKIDLRPLLPKPATAKSMLALAKAWWDGSEFRKPLK